MFGFRKNDSNQPKDESIDQSVLDSIREKLAHGSVDQLSDHVANPSFIDHRKGLVNAETQNGNSVGSVQSPKHSPISSAVSASSSADDSKDEDEEDDYDEDEEDDSSFASAPQRPSPINSGSLASSRPDDSKDEEDEDEEDEDEDDYDEDEDDYDEDEEDEDEEDDSSFASAPQRPSPINSGSLEGSNATQAPPLTMTETEKKVKNTINSGIMNLSQQLGTIRDQGGLDFSQNIKIQVFDMFSKLAELEVKKWIIANLPSLVESLTKEEISRIIKNSIKDSNG